MQALYIMSDDSLDDKLSDALWQYCDKADGDKNGKRLLALLEHDWQHGYSVSKCVLDPSLASLPEDVRRMVLFGEAFAGSWSMSDVYLVMVQDDTIVEAAHY